MRLIDADALDMAFTNLRFNKDMSLAHWGDRKDWCLHGHEVEKLIYDAPTIGGWISVKDKEKLPKGECIAYSSKFDEMMIGYIGEAQNSDTGYLAENEYEFLYNVTHWMPLPESPNGV